jgi:hypothetical protein
MKPAMDQVHSTIHDNYKVFSFRSWNVNAIGSHKFRIGYFRAKLDALHPSLVDRLGKECQEVLVKQPVAQIIQVRGE